MACVLAGRDAERAGIAALLEAARGSSGGALVIRGATGSGKPTLLADAAGPAADMTVLRTQGVERSPRWRSPRCSGCCDTALLFAARDGDASGFDAGELPCLTLPG